MSLEVKYSKQLLSWVKHKLNELTGADDFAPLLLSLHDSELIKYCRELLGNNQSTQSFLNELIAKRNAENVKFKQLQKKSNTQQNKNNNNQKKNVPAIIDIHFLLFGHRGWIGKQIVEHIKHIQEESTCYNIKISLSSVRVSSHLEVESEIQLIKPTHIISTIGRTHGRLDNGKEIHSIDYLESLDKVTENVHDNLFAPMVLALLSVKYNIHLTYLGTGCIFEHPRNNLDTNKLDDDDNKEETTKYWKENDLPNFSGSQYSLIKGFTDQLISIMEYNENILNVRIRMPISDMPSSRNLITKLIQYENIVISPNSMTVLDDLLPIMIDMSLKKKYGTINLVNTGYILHSEILEMYKEIINNNHKWNDISIDELMEKGNAKTERSNNCLSTKKLESWYPNQIKPIKVSIRETLIRMKQNMEKLE